MTPSFFSSFFLEPGQMLSYPFQADIGHINKCSLAPTLHIQAVQKHCILLFFLCLSLPQSIFCTDTLWTHVICYAHFWACYVRCAHYKPKMSITGSKLCLDRTKMCLGTTQNVHNRTQSVFEQHQEVFGHHPKCA
jgi:hypothetical protein